MLTGIVMGSASLLTVIFRQQIGVFIQRIGTKKLMVAGLFGNTIGILLFPYSNSFLTLLFSRTLQGSGLIIYFFSALNMITMILPEERRGELFGLYSTVFIIPLLYAPILGSWLSGRFSFQIITIFSTSLAVIVLPLILALKEPKDRLNPEAASFKGLKIRKLAPPLAAVFFIIFADATIVSFLSLAAAKKSIKNFSFFFTFFATSTILIRLILGRVFDRKSRKLIVVLGLMTAAVGVFFLSFLSFPFLIVAGLIYGAGFGISDSNIYPLLMKNCGKEFEAASATLYSMVFDSAHLIAPPLMGFIAGVSSFRLMFLTASALIVFASINLLFFKTSERKT